MPFGEHIAQRPAALRCVPRKAWLPLAARSNCISEHALAYLVAGYSGPELIDDAVSFVADGQTRFDWILAFHDVDVGSANGGEAHAHPCFAGAGHWDRFFLETEPAGRVKYIGSHDARLQRRAGYFFGCYRHRFITPLYRRLGSGGLHSVFGLDRKSTRLNSSHIPLSRMPSS